MKIIYQTWLLLHNTIACIPEILHASPYTTYTIYPGLSTPSTGVVVCFRETSENILAQNHQKKGYKKWEKDIYVSVTLSTRTTLIQTKAERRPLGAVIWTGAGSSIIFILLYKIKKNQGISNVLNIIHSNHRI